MTGFRAWLRRRASGWRRWWTEDMYPPEAAEAPDDVMAVADAVAEDQGDDDTVEIQRAQPWTPDRQWRASEAWLVGAVEGFDWGRAEAEVTRGR